MIIYILFIFFSFRFGKIKVLGSLLQSNAPEHRAANTMEIEKIRDALKGKRLLAIVDPPREVDPIFA
jgi:hypothetical protein